MTTTPTEDLAPSVLTFRDARWTTRWLVIGLIVLLLWRSVWFVDRDWLSQFPSWLLIIITGVVPQILLLIFPLITANPHRRPKSSIPAPSRCLIEFGIAIPVVIGTIVVLAAVNYLVGRISPGTSLEPGPFTNIAALPNRMLVYLLLVFSFTVAPIAEEVFFRGFLHNAFRARMPLLVAGLAQCLIFGVSHFIGVAHTGIAFALGLLLTAVYEWRKTLITPVLVHAGYNCFAALGVVVLMVARANSAVLGVVGGPDDAECVIRQVVPDSAAEEADLQVGDTVTPVNDEPIHDFPHLVDTVRLYRPGDAIRVTINRSGAVFEVTVVLRRRGSP